MVPNAHPRFAKVLARTARGPRKAERSLTPCDAQSQVSLFTSLHFGAEETCLVSALSLCFNLALFSRFYCVL